MKPRRIVAAIAVTSLIALAGPAIAHYCSNIFGAHARLIVKAETSTVNISGGTATLKVFLQNNFPYKLTNVAMRGSATGYTITVAPNSQTVYPGQQVLYTYTIKGGSGSVAVSKLNLEVKIRIGGWQGDSDPFVDPTPSVTDLKAGSVYQSSLGDQTPSFNAATLADKFPTTKLSSSAPFFGRTGMQQLIHWFGYPYCYKSDGKWSCFSSQQCPSPCTGSSWSSTAQFAQNCMRAGLDVAIRKAKLGSNLAGARAGAINALSKSPSNQHKCLAAVVGGHLWKGASSTASFKTGLNSVSSNCKAAGLRALGEGTKSSCTSGQYYEKAACAAAEGLRGNDAPVNSVLKPSAGDGSYSTLYYSYMLYIVTGDRWAQGKAPSYYPAVGPPPVKKDTGVAPKQDKGVGPQPDTGPPPQLDGFIPGSDSVKPGLDGAPPAGDGGVDGPRGDDGCSCRVGGSGGSAPLAALMLALVLGLALFRRRH
jgi:MYXO-CTERM domain-containing protein